MMKSGVASRVAASGALVVILSLILGLSLFIVGTRDSEGSLHARVEACGDICEAEGAVLVEFVFLSRSPEVTCHCAILDPE